MGACDHATGVSRLGAALLALATLAGGCGDDSTGGPAAAPVAVEEFCGQLVEDLCAAADRCGCGTFVAEVTGECPDFAARVCPLAEGRALRAAVDDGSVAYDELAAGRYLAAFEEADCVAPPLCGDGLCIGLSLEGEPCGDTLVCEAGLACVAGTCRVPLAVGEGCDEAAACETRRCAGGLCEVGAANGEACAVDAECESGRCDFSSGRCAAPIAEGELCTEHTDCASGYCDGDLELGAGTCRERRADGESCDEDPQCTSGACIGGRCGAALCDPIL